MPSIRTALGTALPLTVAQFKAYCKVEHNHDDNLFENAILAAYDYLEQATYGHSIREDTFADSFESWQTIFNTARFPITTVTSVKYRDANNVEQTVSSSDYLVQAYGLESSIRFKSSFSAPSFSLDYDYPITVTYKAGYGADAKNLPQTAKFALMTLVSHWYENREGVLVGTMSKELEHSLTAMISLLSRPSVYRA